MKGEIASRSSPPCDPPSVSDLLRTLFISCKLRALARDFAQWNHLERDQRDKISLGIMAADGPRLDNLASRRMSLNKAEWV